MLNIPEAVAKLRSLLAEMKKTKLWEEIVEPRDQVLAKFQPLFASSHLPSLTEDEFRPFLYDYENHHWSGLHRQSNRLCQDIPKLRLALLTLLDESQPIQHRLDAVAGTIKGFGKATITAVLHVAYPSKYGVWNNTSEAGLVELGIYPEFERAESFGSCYVKINSVLNDLASALSIDLWTLDALWWMLQKGESLPAGVAQPMTPGVPITPLPDSSGSPTSNVHVFGLERHLHDFLYYNWDKIDLGVEWAIYRTPADEDKGYEFACPVGRIDILAKHRKAKKWLVVELKRNETTDSVVGQALRYMGWIRHHLAETGDEVQGLIIAHEYDDALRYAVSSVPNLDFQIYEVEFRLRLPPPIEPRK
jgi:hypothetical protein